MSGFADLANIEDERIRQLIAEVTPYRAIVTALDGDLVTFIDQGAVTAGAQAPRLDGFDLDVADEVLIVGRKNPIVLGRIMR